MKLQAPQRNPLKHRQKVKIGDIFIHQETNGVVCSICFETYALNEFVSGKNWNELKMGYLMWHLRQEVHADFITTKLQNQNGQNCTNSYLNARR
jgi:hypothetical protein